MFSNIGSAFMFLSAESTWHADRARRLLDCGCAKDTVYAICGEMDSSAREKTIGEEERKLFLEPMVVSPQRPPSATDYANLRYEVTHRQRVIDRLKEREKWFEQRIEQLEKFGKEVSAELGEMKKKHPPPAETPAPLGHDGRPPPLRLVSLNSSVPHEQGVASRHRASLLEEEGKMGGMTPALPLLPIPTHSLKKEVSWHDLGGAGGDEPEGSKETECSPDLGGKTPRLGSGSAMCSPGCSCVWTNTWCMDRNAYEAQLAGGGGGAMTSGAAEAALAASLKASAEVASSATPGLPQPPPRIDLGGTWGVRMEPFSAGKEQVAEGQQAQEAEGAEEEYEEEQYDPNEPWCTTCHPQSGCDGDHGDEMRGGYLLYKGRDYRLFPELKAPAACSHGHIGSDPPCRTCWEEDGSNSPWLRTRWGMAEIMKGGGGGSS
jgi:hypothetical protein